MKIVDRFYAYCSLDADTKGNRDAASRLRGKAKRTLWTTLFAGALVSCYLPER